MSGTIRIHDLAEPELSEFQRAVIAGAEALPVDFREEAVLAAAVKRSGLKDFGAEDFRERLRVQLASFAEDEGLNGVGRVGAFRDCVRYAANRLRLVDLLRRHPEIEDEKIERPLVIAGLPRSGTTHLLNLVAADPQLRSLPYWESLEPFPAPDERPGPDGIDPRLARCRKQHALQDRLTPLLKNMHDLAPEHVHEEIELMALDFSCYGPEWIATVPRWRDYYLAHDQTPHYAYLKRALQALQWLRGPRRWVLKSPQHMEQLGPLRAVFPDATLVIPHRDPLAVIASAITMLCYGDRLRRRRVEPARVAAYWTERIELLLRACVRDRALWPEAQSLDVRFHEFMADDLAMVARIYARAGLPLDEAARAAHARYLAENPRGKHGRMAYDLAGDFGLDVGELRERFAFYVERFGLEVEIA